MVNTNGTITEGTFTEDGKRNGWCITFIGSQNAICYGWFKNDIKVGNYCKVKLFDLKIDEKVTGYYKNKKKIGGLREGD